MPRNGFRKIAWWWLVLLAALALSACREEYVHVGEHWAALSKLAEPADPIAVRVSGPDSGAVGDKVQFKVTARDDGYLWVVAVDSEDRVSLLFPNDEERDNRVTGGRERLVPGGSYAFVLDKPTGVHLLAFVVTSQERGLDQVLPAPVRDALQRDTAEDTQTMGVVLDRGLRWGWQKQVLKVN